MEFNREEFKGMLDVAKIAIDQRDFIPILSHFCFSGTQLTAYNDLLGIQIPCKTNFVCALQAVPLLQLINSTTAETIEIGFTSNTAYLKTGRPRKGMRARLPYMGKDDFFFKWPNAKRLDAFTLNKKQTLSLIKGLKLCLSSVGDQHLTQMGIVIRGNKSTVILNSTNNKAISRYSFRGNLDCFDNDILPESFCKAIIKASETYGSDELEIRKGKDFVLVEFGKRCRIYSKLINNKDPLDFEKVIAEHLPADHKKEVHKFDGELEESFRRALIILSNELTKTVTVQLDGKLATVEARSSIGKLKSSATFPKNLGKFAFRIDAEFVVKALETTDSIYFGKKAVVFFKGGYMHLLATMPAE